MKRLIGWLLMASTTLGGITLAQASPDHERHEHYRDTGLSRDRDAHHELGREYREHGDEEREYRRDEPATEQAARSADKASRD